MTVQGLNARMEAIKEQLNDLVRDVKTSQMYNEQDWINFENYLNDISNLDFNK